MLLSVTAEILIRTLMLWHSIFYLSFSDPLVKPEDKLDHGIQSFPSYHDLIVVSRGSLKLDQIKSGNDTRLVLSIKWTI